MSTQTNPTPEPEATPLKRVFKIGANRIVEDAAIARMTNEQVRDLLKSQYPEVAHATIRETTSGDTRLVEYLPVAGRKG